MDDEIKTSEFNEAQLQILRLNNIWISCRRYRESGRLIDLKWALTSGEIELSKDAERLDKTKNTNWAEKIEKMNEKIEQYENPENQKEFFKVLIQKEKQLKALQEDAGKGTKLKFEREKF